MGKFDVFISYSRKDIPYVKELIDRLMLEIPQLKIWYDIDGIESAADFQSKIINAIDESHTVLFVCLENSMISEYCRKEIMYAKNTEKIVVPYLLPGMKLKGWLLFEFGNINCIDSTKKDQVSHLIADLKQWIGDYSNEDESQNELSSEANDYESYVEDDYENYIEEENWEIAREKPFVMPIEDTFYIEGIGLVVTGRINTGIVRTGDTVLVKGKGANLKGTVKGVEMFRKILDMGEAGDNVGLLISGLNKDLVNVGMIVCHPNEY